MNSNQKHNQAAINKFRNELKAMLGDISDIDRKCLSKSVNIGLVDAKRNTPVGRYKKLVNFSTKDGQQVRFSVSQKKVGGFMRRSWYTYSTIVAKGKEIVLANSADYASYVNDGHRIVNKSGETVGWVKGKFILERAVNKVDRALQEEFRKEVERVNKKHDK